MFNKVLNKAKGKAEPTSVQTPPPSGASAETPNPKPEVQSHPASAQAPGGSSASKAHAFIAEIKSRRTIYALGKDPVLSDKDLIELIQEAVRESPSSFNSQTSRIVILLGEEHDSYWQNIVLSSLRKVTDDAGFEHAKGRIDGFKAGYGTVLFYEDQKTIEQFQSKFAAYKDLFPLWSAHASGYAQSNTWIALELAGYGANLQHYNNLTSEHIAEKYNVDKAWKLNAELVFGSPKGAAGDKTYIDNAERFKVFGSK
ncbi:hypothetical protein CBS101457_003672 [Exobasidium rhododendri]|nr:hypothetical protein CBS101457_003672 [Exobasidium rhododendri]